MSEAPAMPRERLPELEAQLRALEHEQLVRALAFQIAWEAYADQVYPTEPRGVPFDLARFDRTVVKGVAELFETYGLTQAAQ